MAFSDSGSDEKKRIATAEVLTKLHKKLEHYNQSFPVLTSEARQAVINEQFQEETRRITGAAAAATTAPSSGLQGAGATTIPTFFLKARNPDGFKLLDKLNAATITMELDMRANQIEEFDTVAHKKVFDLLSCDGARQTVPLEDYLELVEEFEAWRRKRLAEGLAHADFGPCVPFEDQPIRSLNFVPSVVPRLTLEMFITCPRNASGRVSVKTLFQNFSRQVAQLKTEAELIMWDSDNDGRLSEEEMEAYIKYLIPSIPSISKIPEESIPFYTCAVNRRIFWVLDPCNRGFVKIRDLVRSQLMSEWLELQLAPDDATRNWFALNITSQLYEKFLSLDTRETGMLTAANMKVYKKGIPTVVDDGLPANVSPLSSAFIDRVFEVCALYKSEMDYKSFVDFVIAVEFVPHCSRPQYFWNAFDIHNSGVLTPMTVMHFFRDTYQKLVTAGVEVPPLELVMQELFDIIPTREPLRITREEFVKATQAGLFSALIIDCLAFWSYENREQK